MDAWYGVLASPLGTVYVFLLYGLAFIALGLVSMWQARSPIRVLPAGPLWCLAGFGLLHGAHEWIELGLVVQADFIGEPQSARLQLANFLLVIGSFVLLMQAGVELLVSVGRYARIWRVLPAAALSGLVLFVVANAHPFVGATDLEWLPTAEALDRYLFGFVGSVLVAYALFLAGRRQHGPRTERIKAYLTWSAVAFAAYGAFTGLIVAPAPFPPATSLNTETFLAATGIPVQLLRGACAFAIAVLMSELFVVEAGRVRWELDREREEFISVVAHDMRSPIAAINLNAEVLERLLPEAHEVKREQKLFSGIRASASNLNRMVGDLLDASRIETNRLALTLEHVDPGRLLPEIVERAAELTKGHPVSLQLQGRAACIVADPGRFEQVVDNLLSNAAKYSDPDSEIIVTVEERPREVVFSVTNCGPGITPEEQLVLFTRFHRGARAERGDAAGLGLGLYIAKGLVDAQGGRIWVKSGSGSRTTFSFTLPRARDGGSRP